MCAQIMNFFHWSWLFILQNWRHLHATSAPDIQAHASLVLINIMLSTNHGEMRWQRVWFLFLFKKFLEHHTSVHSERNKYGEENENISCIRSIFQDLSALTVVQRLCMWCTLLVYFFSCSMPFCFHSVEKTMQSAI